MLVIIKNKNKIRTKVIKILTVFPINDAKFDNVVVETIKLILLITTSVWLRK